MSCVIWCQIWLKAQFWLKSRTKKKFKFVFFQKTHFQDMISRRFGTFGVVWTPLSENFFLYTNNFGPSGYFWAPPMGQNDFFLVCRLCHLAQGVCVGVLRKKKTSQSPMSCVILCRIWLGAQFQRKSRT